MIVLDVTRSLSHRLSSVSRRAAANGLASLVLADYRVGTDLDHVPDTAEGCNGYLRLQYSDYHMASSLSALRRKWTHTDFVRLRGGLGFGVS